MSAQRRSTLRRILPWIAIPAVLSITVLGVIFLAIGSWRIEADVRVEEVVPSPGGAVVARVEFFDKGAPGWFRCVYLGGSELGTGAFVHAGKGPSLHWDSDHQLTITDRSPNLRPPPPFVDVEVDGIAVHVVILFPADELSTRAVGR